IPSPFARSSSTRSWPRLPRALGGEQCSSTASKASADRRLCAQHGCSIAVTHPSMPPRPRSPTCGRQSIRRQFCCPVSGGSCSRAGTVKVSRIIVEGDEMTDVNKTSAQLLHFVTAVDERRQLFSFVCESQPLATVRSYGHPKRCPFCQQANPISTSF